MKRFEREIRITHATPGNRWGAANIWFNLKGKRGAVAACFRTNWILVNLNGTPTGATTNESALKITSLAFHSFKPTSATSTEPINTHCEFLGSKPCYVEHLDHLREANTLENILLTEGSEGVWTDLEKIYALTRRKK
jgi:hypothetical protein